MHEFNVKFEGTSAKREHFIREVEIEAENEIEVRKVVEDLFKAPTSKGILYDYSQGHESVTCTVEITLLK
jgi:hypothetical protein